MRNKLIITAMALVAIITMSLAVVGSGEEEEEPVSKTYTITLKDGNLVFVVEYKALPSEEPAYLAYLKTRLSLFVNSTNEDDPEMVDAVNHLMNKGSSFKIEVEYDGASYVGMVWNTTKKAFTVHNDWIKDAKGTDLKGSSIITTFNAVE
jgi:hypothetical protein